MENFTEKIPPIFTAPPIQFFVAIFLFIALLNDQRELTILSLIIMAVYWGTVIWSKAAGTGLESNSKVDRDRVFPDEFFSLDFNFVNNKLLPVLVYINIPLSRSLYLQENQGPPLKESRLLWYQKASFLWKIAAKKRGYYRIGHSDIKVGDLFSFCLRDLRIGDGIQIIVYPRLVTLKSFPLPKREFFGIPGGKSPVEDPAYFMGTREYNHWRPSRYIHWKASARHNRLQEKLFEPSEQEKLFIIFDVQSFSENNAYEEFERSIEVIASLVIDFNHKGYSVGFLSNGRTYLADKKPIAQIDKHHKQVPLILEILAGLKHESGYDLMDLLQHNMFLPWDSSCLLFSFKRDETANKVLDFMKHQNIPTAFVLCGSSDETGIEGQFRGISFSIEDLHYSKTETE